MTRKADAVSLLPPSLPPRGLSRDQASAYIGVSSALFDEMIRDGRMPAPKLINRRRVWDRAALDLAFAKLPSEGGPAQDEDEDVWSCARV